jgi:hypothetical protein
VAGKINEINLTSIHHLIAPNQLQIQIGDFHIRPMLITNWNMCIQKGRYMHKDASTLQTNLHQIAAPHQRQWLDRPQYSISATPPGTLEAAILQHLASADPTA